MDWFLYLPAIIVAVFLSVKMKEEGVMNAIGKGILIGAGSIAVIAGVAYFLWLEPRMSVLQNSFDTLNGTTKKYNDQINDPQTGLGAKATSGEIEKLRNEKITPMDTKITAIQESYLKQDKEIHKRLLAIEKRLEIDTEEGKKQLEDIEGEIKSIDMKRKGLASGIVNQDVVTGIVESLELDTGKIRLKQSYGETVDYTFSSNTKILIMKGSTRIEGSREDIVLGKAVLLMSVLKGGAREASLIVLPANEK